MPVGVCCNLLPAATPSMQATEQCGGGHSPPEYFTAHASSLWPHGGQREGPRVDEPFWCLLDWNGQRKPGIGDNDGSAKEEWHAPDTPEQAMKDAGIYAAYLYSNRCPWFDVAPEHWELMDPAGPGGSRTHGTRSYHGDFSTGDPIEPTFQGAMMYPGKMCALQPVPAFELEVACSCPPGMTRVGSELCTYGAA